MGTDEAMQDDLDAWLGEAPPDDGAVDRPEVADEADADRLLWRIRKARREQQRIAGLAATRIAAIQAWAADRAAGPERVEQEATRALEGYARKTGKTTISLPGGALSLRKRPASLVVDDEHAAAWWAATNLPSAVKATVMRGFMKAMTTARPMSGDEHGDTADAVYEHAVTADGEVVPGVHYETPTEPSFTITIKSTDEETR